MSNSVLAPDRSLSQISLSNALAPQQISSRAHTSLHAELFSVRRSDGGQLSGVDVSFSDDEIDSMADEQRPPSSDEGFGGKHFDSDGSTEDLARKQVLMMYEMQLDLMRKLRKEKSKLKTPKENADNPKFLPLRKRSGRFVYHNFFSFLRNSFF